MLSVESKFQFRMGHCHCYDVDSGNRADGASWFYIFSWSDSAFVKRAEFEDSFRPAQHDF